MAFSTSLEGIPEADADASDGLIASKPTLLLRRKRSGMVVQASTDAPAPLDVATRPSKTRCRIHPLTASESGTSSVCDTPPSLTTSNSPPTSDSPSTSDSQSSGETMPPNAPKRLRDRSSSFARQSR